ncbi:MAG: hypothetical protein HKP61_13325 [Dactylosporangium sp.]|nr:hypothetical protein [Dactylosporangium sp.]NNJ61897.1 hypothetical protein [Dactylosporangium sp.]
MCRGSSDVTFPWWLPPELLRLPRYGVVNLHPSLLPRHRGPIPVHWAIRAGDPTTGVTAHLMNEGFDTGPILAQEGASSSGKTPTPRRCSADSGHSCRPC